MGGVNAGNIAEFTSVCAGTGIGSAIYRSGKLPQDVAVDAETLVHLAK